MCPNSELSYISMTVNGPVIGLLTNIIWMNIRNFCELLGKNLRQQVIHIFKHEFISLGKIYLSER